MCLGFPTVTDRTQPRWPSVVAQINAESFYILWGFALTDERFATCVSAVDTSSKFLQ
jgi:hypothetical protein